MFYFISYLFLVYFTNVVMLSWRDKVVSLLIP